MDGIKKFFKSEAVGIAFVLMSLVIFCSICIAGCTIREDGTLYFETLVLNDDTVNYVINPTEDEDISSFQYKLTGGDNFVMYFNSDIGTLKNIQTDDFGITFTDGHCSVVTYKNENTKDVFIFSDYSLETLRR